MSNSRLKIDGFTPTSYNNATDADYGKVLLLLNGSGSVTKDSSSYNRTLTKIENGANGPTALGPQLDSSRMLFGTPMYKLDGDLVGQVGLGYSGSDVVLGANEYCFEGFVDFTSVTGDVFFLSFQNISITYRHSTKSLYCSHFLGGTYNVASGNNSILPGNLYHIALCRTHNVPSYPTDGRLLLFINGTLVGYSSLFSKTSSWSISGTMYLLGCHYPNKATFHIGQVRFTNGASRYYGTTLNTKYFDVPTSAFLSSDIASDPGNSVPQESSWVDVVATKNSYTTNKVRVYVNKAPFSPAAYMLLVYPGVYNLAATSDGTVYPTSYENAIVYASITNKGIAQDITDWSLATSVSSGLGISSATKGVNDIGQPAFIIPVTSLAAINDTGTITLTATRPDYPTLTNIATIGKNKDSMISGVKIGATYLAFSTTQPTSNAEIFIKFRTNGEIQIKEGTSGTYYTAAAWYMPFTSGIGNTKYINMQYTPISGTLVGVGSIPVSGSSFISLSTEREYKLSNSTIGEYEVTILPRIADNSSGDNGVTGQGTLKLTVTA